jgi:hypothetical protein
MWRPTCVHVQHEPAACERRDGELPCPGHAVHGSGDDKVEEPVEGKGACKESALGLMEGMQSLAKYNEERPSSVSN